MRTYHCHKCDAKYRRDPEQMRAFNPKAWCYCDPDVPMRLSDMSNQTLDKKYGSIFQMKNQAAVKLGSLGGKARWRDKTKAERSEHGKRMVEAREQKRNVTPYYE